MGVVAAVQKVLRTGELVRKVERVQVVADRVIVEPPQVMGWRLADSLAGVGYVAMALVQT